MSSDLISSLRDGLNAELAALPADKAGPARDALTQASAGIENFLSGFGGNALGASNWLVKQANLHTSIVDGTVDALLLEIANDASDAAENYFSLLNGEIKLSALSLTLQVSIEAEGLSPAFSLRGQFEFKGHFLIPARLQIPALDGSITLECEPGLSLVDLNALCSLLGDTALIGQLPAGLTGIAGLELSYLRIELAPDFSGIRAFAFAIGSQSPWTIIAERLVIRNLRLNFCLQLGENTALTGYLLGSLALGPVDVTLAVTRFAADDDWQLAVQSRRIALPDLNALSRLAGTDLANLLPDILASLAMTIYDLNISVNLNQTRLERLAFQLAANQPVVLANYLPTLQDVYLALQLDTLNGQHYGVMGAGLDIAGTIVPMKGELANGLTLSGQVPTLQLDALLGKFLSGLKLPDTLPKLTLSNCGFSIGYAADNKGAWDVSIAAALSSDLSDFAQALGIALPETLSKLTLDRLALSRDSHAQAWQLDIRSSQPIAFDPRQPEGLAIADIALAITYNDAGTHIECGFVLHGEVKVAEEVALQFTQLAFHWSQADKQWRIKGDVSVIIVGSHYPLQASVVMGKDGNAISLRYPSTLTLSHLDGAGAVNINDLRLFTQKVIEQDKTLHRWGVSGSVAIKIEHLLEVNGSLELQTGDDGTRLTISAQAPSLPPIALPLEFPQNPELHISLDALTIAYRKDASGKTGWALTSAAHLQIAHIPALLSHYLPPEPLRGYLRADGKTVALGFDVPSTLQPAFPELGFKFANGERLSLGKPQFAITAIELQLGEQPKLVQKLHVGIPAQLNNLFGRDQQGRPNLEIFNDAFELQLVLAKKLSMTLATSPLKPLSFYPIKGDDGLWTKWNFGTLGEIEFRVPEFSFQGGRWRASGGFHRLTDIGLPLAPIKFLLEKSGFPKALIKAMPNSLALKDIDLTGDNFAAEMKFILGDEVLGRLDKNSAAVLNKLFDAVRQVIDRLPHHLQDYLQIRIPKSAIFEISVDTTGGGTSLALRTLEKDPPLKFLFPMMAGLPELVGISLRGLSIGQTLGGSLALIEIDGHIDRLDMVSLTAALLLGNQDISNRYILERSLFVLPTAFPLPIPLFFSQLGLDYRDVLGFNIQAHWSYPDPQLGVLEFISLFSELMHFFIEPDYLLHKHDFGKTLGLELTIGENFIGLPAYLGGQTLGLQKALPTLSVGDSVARFLDFLKTGNAGYAITAIPLQHDGVWIRLGSEEIHFGPLVIGMSWCISTDEEFVKTIIPASKQHGELPISFDDAVLQSLPKSDSGGSASKGFIILLMGHAELGSIVGMRTEFGIAVTAQGGFETGFRMSGEIGRALRLQMFGTIHADEHSVSVKGGTGLFWKEQPLITASGGIIVSDTALEVDITITLSPFFHLQGLLRAGEQGLLMSGKAAWGHGADGPSEGIAARVEFNQTGMHIGFDWRLAGLDGEVQIHVPGDGDKSLFSASVSLQPNMQMQQAFSASITSLAKSVAENTVDKIYNTLQNAIAEVKSLEISVHGLRNWLPALCDTIIKMITDNINANTTGWKKPGRVPAHKIAKPYITRLTTLRDVARKASDETIRELLKAALQDIVDHNHLKIAVGVPAVRWKKNRWGIPYPVYYTAKITVYERDLMNAQQLAQLNTAIKHIDQLPAKNGVLINTQKIYDQLPPRDKLLGEINREIKQGVTGAIPKIESIAFATSLELLDISKLNVGIHYTRGATAYTASLTLDLSDPVKATGQLVDAFGRS